MCGVVCHCQWVAVMRARRRSPGPGAAAPGRAGFAQRRRSLVLISDAVPPFLGCAAGPESRRSGALWFYYTNMSVN